MTIHDENKRIADSLIAAWDVANPPCRCGGNKLGSIHSNMKDPDYHPFSLKDELKTDPETGQQYIVIDVRCTGCGEPVSPNEVDWELFRIGIAAHKDNESCYEKIAEKMHGGRVG